MVFHFPVGRVYITYSKVGSICFFNPWKYKNIISLEVPIHPTLPRPLVKRAFIVAPDGLVLNLQFNLKPVRVETNSMNKYLF